MDIIIEFFEGPMDGVTISTVTVLSGIRPAVAWRPAVMIAAPRINARAQPLARHGTIRAIINGRRKKTGRHEFIVPAGFRVLRDGLKTQSQSDR